MSTPQKSTFITIEGTREEFRAREILKVQSTESYRTDSRIRLGTGAYRQLVPFPFPAGKAEYLSISVHTSEELNLYSDSNTNDGENPYASVVKRWVSNHYASL